MTLSDSFPIALTHFVKTVDNHYPKNKLLQFAMRHKVVFPVVVNQLPLFRTVNVFTDGSNNGTTVYVCKKKIKRVHTPPASAQVVELKTTLLVFQDFSQVRFNLFSNSHYVVQALRHLKTVSFINTINSTIQHMFLKIQKAIHNQTKKCYIRHLRAHSRLPGPLSLENAQANVTTQIIGLTQVKKTQIAHSLHHQNSHSLRLQFNIPREAARQIVKQCSSCPQLAPVPYLRVNPRGIRPRDL